MKIKRIKALSGRPLRAVLYRLAIMGLLAILLLIASYLAYNTIQYTCLVEYSQQIWLEVDEPFPQILPFLLICLLAAGVEVLLRMIRTKEEWVGLGVLAVCGVLMLVTGLRLIAHHPYYPEGDQLIVASAASDVRQGIFNMFVKGGYMGLFPQQKGFVFFYQFLFAIFGDFCYDVAEKLHVIYYVLTLVFGYFTLKNFRVPVSGRIAYCCLMVCCVPYLIYIPYFYGDMPAIFYTIVLFWALSSYEKRLQKRYVAIAAAAAALALMMRQNTLIVLIAVGICMALTAMRGRNWYFLTAMACVVGVALGSVELIGILYQARSGYERNMGIPQVLWVAMGLQEEKGMPGRYNRYQQSVFEETGYDQEEASEIGWEYIHDRLEEFGENRLQARYFFHRKLQQQWTEPTFESFCYTASFSEEEEVPEGFEELYFGERNTSVRNFCNYYQSTVYLAFWIFVISKIADVIQGTAWKQKGQQMTFWIPLIAIVGGFLFSAIWESKCRYVFPYYMYMLLYVPIGFRCLLDIAEGAGARGKAWWERRKGALTGREV